MAVANVNKALLLDEQGLVGNISKLTQNLT